MQNLHLWRSAFNDVVNDWVLEMPKKMICTSDEKKQTVFFKLFGSSKDKLALTVECQKCECNYPGVENSEMCSKNGTFACNSCQCK